MKKSKYRILEGPWGPLGLLGAQVGQEDRTMSNCCIKERKEERKTRGPRGAWKEPYLDPKGALGGPQRVPQGDPSSSLGGPIRAPRGLNWGS
jgi:hypothetical protein